MNKTHLLLVVRLCDLSTTQGIRSFVHLTHGSFGARLAVHFTYVNQTQQISDTRAEKIALGNP
jgi:flagellar hook-basal body complex protein FliE